MTRSEEALTPKKHQPPPSRDLQLPIPRKILTELKPRPIRQTREGLHPPANLNSYLIKMPRRNKGSHRIERNKLVLTIHPDVRAWAKTLAGRRSVGQLFEDLVEAEWTRLQSQSQPMTSPTVPPHTPFQHQVFATEAEFLASLRYQQPLQQQQ